MSNPFDDRYRRNGEWFPDDSRVLTDATWERLSRATVLPPGPVLSAGCGTGRVTDTFFASDREVAGFDVSPRAIELAQTRMPSAVWTVADAGAEWPYPDRSFALVIDEFCLHHLDWPNRVIFLQEARRVIRDEGVFLLGSNLWGGKADDTRSDRTTSFDGRVVQTYPTEEELRSEVARAGFVVERFEIVIRDLQFAEVVARPRIGGA